MKDRLRADLRIAMKDRPTGEARLIRALIAAIDNAEAPPAEEEQMVQYQFRHRPTEVERLLLSRPQVRQVLLAESHERERAAAELERLKKLERAEALRSEVLFIKSYLDSV